VEPDFVETAAELLGFAESRGVRILLPTDVVAARGISDMADVLVCDSAEIPPDWMGLDIGPATAEAFKLAVASAKTVFWNGPMGVFECKPFESGTRQVALAISRNREAFTVVGGGDSAAALKAFELEDRVSFVSTGGGASMQFIEGSPLPGILALSE
jgi:phosphoglycerate kinase